MRASLRALRIPAGALLCGLTAGCAPSPDLVVYCSLDQEFSEPLIAEFERATGLDVDAQFDVERNKTVGLVQRIRAEAGHPRADVFWNNEIAHTLRLKDEGLTEAFDPANAATLPEAYRDPQHHWHGFAARARVLLHRTDRPVRLPQNLDEMLVPEIARSGALAKPLTGTTLTNFAVLAELRGREGALAWLRRAEASGLRWGSGNADVMRGVARGEFDWCLTDTDDAAAAIQNGYPVAIAWLDQGPPGSGTLLIPNTVAILRGAPHRAAAERFVNWLLSPAVEARLAASPSRQIPLHPGVAVPDDAYLPGRDFTTLDVNWLAVARAIEACEKEFRALLVD
jgi:iron(III) transport system substrate-binding protein